MSRLPSISIPKVNFALKGNASTIRSTKFTSTTYKSTRMVGSSMRFSSVAQPLSQDEILPRVVNVVTNFYKTDNSKQVNLKTHFTNDLGLDSLDQVELVLALEDEFVIEVPDEAAEKIHTVEDAVKYIASTKVAK